MAFRQSKNRKHFSFRHLFLFLMITGICPALYKCAVENVIFEQIGEMAGASSYLHAHVTVSVSSIEEQYFKYVDILDNKYSTTEKIMEIFEGQDTTQGNPAKGIKYNEEIKNPQTGQNYSNPHLKNIARMWMRIARYHRGDMYEVKEHIDSLRNLLPDMPAEKSNSVVHQLPPPQGFHANQSKPDEESSSTPPPPRHSSVKWSFPKWKREAESIADHLEKVKMDCFANSHDEEIEHLLLRNQHYAGLIRPHYRHIREAFFEDSHHDNQDQLLERHRRFAGLVALPMAVAATAMGLYNKGQIEFLKHELTEVKTNVKRLFDVVSLFDHNFQEIQNAIIEISNILLPLLVNNPAVFEARLTRIENQLRDRLHRATHALQAAQHRRLAVDYLSPDQIRSLFAKLKQRAHEFDCELVINHHSDLFQIEVSLLFDGYDAHLLLHVPMVPRQSLLRLFKLHPFPLPFFDNTFLIPEVQSDILAVSSTDQRFSTQLSSTDLLSCFRANQVFLCDRFGVLSRQFNHTCLGALYVQDFDTAKQICHFTIVPASERIYQLKKNWYVVYLPRAHTIPLRCRNGTVTEMHLARGSQRIHISPGCEAKFPDHMVTADLSMKMPADTLHMEWEWDALDVLHMDPAEFAPAMKKLQSFGLKQPSLQDLQYLALSDTPNVRNAHIVHFVGNLILALLIISIICFIAFRCYKRRQARRQPGPVIRSKTEPVDISGSTKELLGTGRVPLPSQRHQEEEEQQRLQLEAEARRHRPLTRLESKRQEGSVRFSTASENVQFLGPHHTLDRVVQQDRAQEERGLLLSHLHLLDDAYPPNLPPPRPIISAPPLDIHHY